jgi:N-acetylglucosamine malate deacetylase 2
MSRVGSAIDAATVRASDAAGAGLIQALCASGTDCAHPLPAIAVVPAHPDDETIGAGSRLPRLRQARFVYVTDGAPAGGQDAVRIGLSPDRYGDVRRRELQAALALCGIDWEQVSSLGYPDQQAALHLARLAQDLAEMLSAWGTQVVLTHPYEGGHPDHDATAFAVHAAAALLQRSRQAPPCIIEMSSYHMGSAGIRVCAFLPDADGDVDGGTATLRLTPEEERHKRAVFDCYATQRETLAQFPIGIECFRPSPRYDFQRPPHEGRLFYECHPWGMTGQRFCSMAAGAMAQLGLEGRL